MPWSIADTDYDNTHPWDSMFNGVPLSDDLQQDPRQQKLMTQAIQTANPATPEAFIRECMTAGTPADAGPARPQPTIESVLDGSALQPNRLYDPATGR
jgi:hypothetical protein